MCLVKPYCCLPHVSNLVLLSMRICTREEKKNQAMQEEPAANCRLIVKFMGCFLDCAKSAPDVQSCE